MPKVAPFDGSPDLVKVLDRIRFGPLEERDDLGEFLWFIREYPRAYRHHIDHAEYRIETILQAYSAFVDEFKTKNARKDGETPAPFDVMSRRGYAPYDTYAVHWDFESYLAAISSALDVAARVVGTAFKQDTPANFNRFCRTAPAGPIKDIFIRARDRWVRRLKAYRDCFTHFTPVDTILVMGVREYPDGFEVRARIPVNPEAREILLFRFSRRVELLKYSATVWKHLKAFDRAIGSEVWRAYRRGEYPVKTQNLFFFGHQTA